MTFADRYGPWALVTGAANGLGAEFARQVAARGLNLVLVDVDAAGLQRSAQALAATGRDVRTVATDLCRADFLDTIRPVIEGLEIGLLINNAGITTIGPFLERSAQQHLQVVDLNVRVPLLLSHALAPAMVQRRRGGILFVGSMSGLQGTAYVASYAATKAHNQILAEGLWAELQGHGVDVTGCMLGTIRTPGFINSKPQLDRAGAVPIMEVGPAVTAALESLGRGPRAVAGRLNRFLNLILQHGLPHARLIRLVSNSTAALYGPR